MKFIRLLFVGIALMGTFVLSAQSKLKFGHVNTQAILSNMPELKAIDEQLKSEMDSLESQLTDMEEELKKIQVDYVTKLQNGTLSGEERNAMETQMQEGKANVQKFLQASQMSIQKKEQEHKLPIFEKVSNAIQEVGTENGFLYIFEEAGGLAVYKSENSIDISDMVKAKLGIK